ncbi:MAG: UMP kinase [Gammaproteobacteria bacterium RIFCSPHIGHO2_12_FULL_42_13]|nr:MAG: UMP kinase [Gammaproteobacteria bacterium RIFCSPHIGHO2_12_FULL_42_13]
MSQPVYKRILLKMSGEALMGGGEIAISPAVLNRLAKEVHEVHKLGVQIAIVIGGGNFCRGVALSEVGISRITGDHMGMVATIMNALALRDAFERSDIPVRILSAVAVGGMVDLFHSRKAMHHLEQGRVLIFSAGTGNPLFTTDSAASLRGIEINADVVLKATNVDGIYSEDPKKNPNAKLLPRITYKEALEKEFAVMDLSAFCQCRDYKMPIRVFNIQKPGMFLKVVMGEDIGTLVS